MTPIIIDIPGPPVAKARVASNKGHRFKDRRTEAYEARVALFARQAMADRQPLPGAVAVAIWAISQPPAGWPLWRQNAATAGKVHPTSKPDADNLAKAILDGCNGIVWIDDAQVSDLTVTKRFGAAACVRVEVRAVLALAGSKAPDRQGQNTKADLVALQDAAGAV